MAYNYYQSTWCGSAIAKHKKEEIEACVVVVATLRKKRRWGGSVAGHKTKNRDRIGGNIRLNNDYFIDRPLFNPEDFHRRFRMQQPLFLEIEHKFAAASKYFRQERNAAGVLGFSTRQKCTVGLRMLAYGGPTDFLDEGLRMGESTVLKTVKEFAKTIIEVFGPEYLRPPSESELQHILSENEARGFLGMIGSIDCMHWEWANCPASLGGMYKGHKGKPTLILEAVATQDLRCWHAFFGLPGSHNDINVLRRSPVFDDLANGNTPAVNFTVNGNPYTLGYYLADGIYPDWATLVKSISAVKSNKQSVFAAQQEKCHKDVERLFGVFQAKWKIMHHAARFWNQRDLNTIALACIILHNMVVENERGVDLPRVHNSEWPGAANPPITPLRSNHGIKEFSEAYSLIEEKSTTQQLQQDLIAHMWELYGSKSGPFAKESVQMN